ncbi:hypothetical protein [Brachybacterium phenoliresistens]|uniref:hypothetical protein n=1 Tax=Brachybacterium phenoliresistens TaxID=396014 RepID=UPI0012EB7555|nr:hypothetical protein [Brachybacterium phenoliresistens]
MAAPNAAADPSSPEDPNSSRAGIPTAGLGKQSTKAIEAISIVPGIGENVSANADNVKVDSQEQKVTIKASDASVVTLDRRGGSASRVESSDGNHILLGSGENADTVIQSLDGGGRIIEVMHSADSPTSFEYDLRVDPTLDVIPQSDGSLVIGTENDGILEIEAVIGAPWAVDADAHPIPVSYKYSDGLLVMEVSVPDGAAFPIVADPTVSAGGFKAVMPSGNSMYPLYVYLNKARTADAEDVGAAICIGIAFVPVVGAVAAAVCGLHNAAIRATSRYGYCQLWKIDPVNRRMIVSLHKTSWCK